MIDLFLSKENIYNLSINKNDPVAELNSLELKPTNHGGTNYSNSGKSCNN